MRKHQPETRGAHRQVQRHLCPALRGLALRRARRGRRYCRLSSRRTLHGAFKASCTASCCRTPWRSMPACWGWRTTTTGWPNVAGYILAHKLERITNRDVQRGDRSMRNLTRRETEAIFEQLDAFGWITRTPGPRPSDPPHWIVNPAVHQKFAERGRAEAERRERERAMISGHAPRGRGTRALSPQVPWLSVTGCHHCHHCPLRA